MKEMLKMVATLTIICLLSGGFLSFLKGYTAPLIEAQELEKVQGPAIRKIFPQFTNNPITERAQFATQEWGTVLVFPIKVAGKLIGVALEQTNAGYGGTLGAMVGFSVETNTIVGVAVTLFKETPGYGTKIYEESFTTQFASLAITEDLTPNAGVAKTISGATVSSTSFIQSVQKATTIYTQLKDAMVAKFSE